MDNMDNKSEGINSLFDITPTKKKNETKLSLFNFL